MLKISALALLGFMTAAQAQVVNFTVIPNGDTLGAPTQDSSGSIHFSVTPGSGPPPSGLANGDYTLSDANGALADSNRCPLFVYSSGASFTVAAVTGGYSVQEDHQHSSGFPSMLFDNGGTPCLSNGGDVFTIAAVTGGYTVQSNTTHNYLADTGAVVNSGGFSGTGAVFQAAPYTWVIQ